MQFVLAALLAISVSADAQDAVTEKQKCDVCAGRKSGMQKIHEARKAKACEQALAAGVKKEGCSLTPPVSEPEE
ncbi:hypothetical protein G5B38_17405 [Pseudohalocynthiibacter aestuariivivens]|nr:hypothetical protein [Pseudohalocynthiibacter aestuariivivens]QIE47160.1 hypothetical protein G5B38_17405 [Pseudohalocynthiibacter aestuariivivens]